VIGLPTLGQLDHAAAGVRIWLAIAPADMRCSFDRLAELAARVTGEDPLSGHLFLFRARRVNSWAPRVVNPMTQKNQRVARDSPRAARDSGVRWTN